MKKPEFHAEYHPDIFYFIPTFCLMKLEDENEKPAGCALQFHLFGICLQWYWPEDSE